MKEQYLSTRLKKAVFFVTPAILLALLHATTIFAQSPAISIQKKADSPLEISLLNTEMTEALLVRILIKNTGDKPISAYSIRHDDMVEGRKLSGMMLSNS